jgi:hypothetical protein
MKVECMRYGVDHQINLPDEFARNASPNKKHKPK